MKEKKEAGGVKGGLSSIYSNDKYKKIIIIAGLIGIALIFASGFFKNHEESVKTDHSKLTTEQYTAQIEKSLTDVVSSINGAGQCKVLVTVENGTEMVYATGGKKNKEASEDRSNGQTTKTQQTDDSEVKYITVKDADGTEKALAITEIQPTVKGVVVVCQGGDDPNVQKRVIDAVTTALNITSKRVCVTKLS